MVTDIYKYIFIMLFALADTSLANDITGTFYGDENWEVSISSPEELNTFILSLGDTNQVADNCISDHFDYCLLFGFIDILIPRNLAVGKLYSYLGSSVKTKEFLTEFQHGTLCFREVYRLEIIRDPFIKINGMLKKRTAETQKFELFFSIKEGLIGFKVPSGDSGQIFVNGKYRSSR